MTLDTPHGSIKEFLKNARKMREKLGKNEGKMKGKLFFPPLVFDSKTIDHNSGLHAKSQREIPSNKVRRLLWPLGGGKCGKGGEIV